MSCTKIPLEGNCFIAVQLFNDAEHPANISLDFPGLDGFGDTFHAWSFWDRTYIGLIDRSYLSRDIPSHGSQLLRLTEVNKFKQPLLIGSDLHISLGAAEIAEVLNKAADSTYAIRLTVGGALSGKLYLYAEQQITLIAAIGCKCTVHATATAHVWSYSINTKPGVMLIS